MKASTENNEGVSFLRQAGEFFVVFSLSLLIRVINLSNDPITDELYHILAARSWLSSGDLMIADGYYQRAAFFTHLVAVVMSVTDGSIDAVRVFCAMLGAVLVGAVFSGTRKFVGCTEAWIAASILALMPGAIFLSQYIRFYSLHAMLFWIAAVLIYVAVCQKEFTDKRHYLLFIAVLLLALAFHLQITTTIGVAGILVGLTAVNASGLWNYFKNRTRRSKIAVAAIAPLTLLAGLAFLIGPGDFLLDIYLGAPLWSGESSVIYYARLYRDQFGFLWALFPLAALIAINFRPRPAIFCLSIFVVAFIGQSFGGAQAERFNFYSMPFFCVIWGIASAFCGRALWQVMQRKILEFRINRQHSLSLSWLSALILALTLLFAVVSTPAVELTIRMVSGAPVRLSNERPLYWSKYQTRWSYAQQSLRSLVNENDVLVSSQGLHALYYFGDLDLEINATRLSDYSSQTGGELDPRTWRMVIPDSRALSDVVDRHASGLVVIHRSGWRNAAMVNSTTADWIEANMQEVLLPEEWGLSVFSWKTNELENNESRHKQYLEVSRTISERPK